MNDDERAALVEELAEAAEAYQNVAQAQGRGSISNVRNHILRDIDIERDRQNEKWGGVQDLTAYQYLAVATEELGEAAQAALHDEFGGNHAGTLRTELVQLAAVVVQWIEHIDSTD